MIKLLVFVVFTHTLAGLANTFASTSTGSLMQQLVDIRKRKYTRDSDKFSLSAAWKNVLLSSSFLLERKFHVRPTALLSIGSISSKSKTRFANDELAPLLFYLALYIV